MLAVRTLICCPILRAAASRSEVRGFAQQISWICEKADCPHRGAGHELAKELKTLPHDFAVEIRHARDIATRPAQTWNKADPDRVTAIEEHDRNRYGCGLGGHRVIDRPKGADHRHLLTHKISRQRRQLIVLVRPTKFDGHVTTFDVTYLTQSLNKCRGRKVRRSHRASRGQNTNHRHRRLLRPRHRPPRRRAPDPCDECSALCMTRKEHCEG